MFNQLLELYSLLTAEQRRKLKRLQVLVVLMAFAEIAGVASIGPFMALVGDISRLQGDGIVAQIYRASGIAEPRDFLFWLGAGVLVVLTVAACISMFTVWKLSMYGQVVGAELSSRIFNYYMHQPWLFHANGNSSQLTNKVSQECQRVTNNIVNSLMKMNAKVVLVSLMIVGIFVYNPLVAITGLFIFVIAYALLFRTVRQKLIRNGENVSKAQQLRFKLLSEGLGGIKDVLLLGRQDIFTDRFEKVSMNFAKSQGTNNALAMSPRYAMELIAFGSVIFLILYLLSAHSGDLGAILPILSVYALAGFKLLPAFQQIYTSLSTIRGSLAAFNNIRNDLSESKDTVTSDYTGLNDNNAIVSNDALKVRSSINLDNVSFTYPGKKSAALNALSMNIPANKTIGIIGSSGSGKSTVIDIILGLIDPDTGSLYIDHTLVNNKNKRSWQNTIGFVPQSIFLSDGSIRENIAFGIPNEQIDDDRIDSAVMMAQLNDMLLDLPDGLLTKVGERGVQLSGGQRQRIGIARALYNDADILVFDEATSALDGITERLIMDAIESLSGSKTIIIIAHRLATVKACDNIYMLSHGAVIAEGKYQSLLESNEQFKAMHKHS
ncbi:ABC transporter ATP-binding protein [Cobetia sp. 4B]|uniref:ABC transporter ATP-binding protein n=1 Tax=Cobetia sp. 4B TaxID=2758724 RepID=UPI001C059C20|nr:ABC transporter ATP-binding protein [Cobetia sp. 4B]QWN35860.1 ABC transporter ATP-binding protein [Cobetia sp. 4B]